MYRRIPTCIFIVCLFLSAGPSPAADPATQGRALGEGFSEGFEDIGELVFRGWVTINNSQPLGLTAWGQGRPNEFPAHQGPDDSYILANFQNTDAGGTISNWLLTPEIELRNGTRVEFWTRSTADDAFPDRLEVRLSTSGDSVDVGLTELSVGDFDRLLLSINPELTGTYPSVWTRYSLQLTGMSPVATGRVAFRYFVTNSGPGGANGDLIGIDTFSIEQPIFTDRFETVESR